MEHMIKRVTAAALGFLLLAAPALALADGLSSTQIQIQQLTAVAAALEAQEAALGGQSIVCAALMSKASVRVGEQVALGWGSVGAMVPSDDPSRPMWTQNGASTLSFTQPGTWNYSFTFYAKSGATATCSANIVVTE